MCRVGQRLESRGGADGVSGLRTGNAERGQGRDAWRALTHSRGRPKLKAVRTRAYPVPQQAQA